MSRFDEKYCVRLAEINDIDNIMSFIDRYWSKGHIMSTNRNYFEYEFLINGQVNFVIAIDRETDTIQGIRGLLFSAADEEKRDYWGSIWKANTGDGNFPLLGTEIRKRTDALIKYRYNLGVGQNMNTTLIVGGHFKKETVRLEHFYRLNPDIKDYKIAVIDPAIKAENAVFSDTTKAERLYDIGEVRSCINIESIDAIPYKDNWYIEHRYFSHPWYDYQVYGLKKNGNTGALMIMREMEAYGSKVLRIVDYIGDHSLIAGLGRFFGRMLTDNGYEYIDFYEYGFEPGYLKEAGLRNKYEDGGGIIIPNYFEPFVQSNKELMGFFDKGLNVTIFKGDGDQDRPNIDRGI